MGRISIIYLYVIIALLSCQDRSADEINKIIDNVREEYAPDSRIAIFDLKVVDAGRLVVSGETNLSQAKKTVIDKLTDEGFDFVDQISMLPDSSVAGKALGLTNVSVANLRANPRHSAELVTQGLLGTPVKVMKKQGGWSLIQTPDEYIAWANAGNITSMDTTTFQSWKNADKLIYLPTYGFSLDSAGNKVSDLVAGNVLVVEGESTENWIVRYPDDRIGLLKKEEAKRIKDWYKEIEMTDESLISAAVDLMGVPYLWGGTSTKGVDCSGFTKTVYLRHGLILPRDASQQVHLGMLVDDQRDFSKLEVGDLLFFGRKNEDGSERVVHVGMWIGNNSFIHASSDVHVSSLDPSSANFDEYNYNRYLRSKRIKGYESQLPVNFSEVF